MKNRLVITHNDVDTVVTSIMSLSIIKEVNSEPNLVPGGAIASELTATIWGNANEVVLVGDKIECQATEDGTEWHSMGEFYAMKPAQNKRTTFTVTAYDCLTQLDVDLTEWIADETNHQYFGTLRSFADKLCEKCGLTLDVANFNSDIQELPFTIPTGIPLTGRQIMSDIAQLNCCYLYAKPNKTIGFGWYADGSVAIQPSGDNVTSVSYKQDGLRAAEYNVDVVTGVSFVNGITNLETDSSEWVDGNVLTISDNTIYNMIPPELTQVVSDTVYSGMRSLPMNYKPCEIELFAHDKINVGTIVAVTDNRTTESDNTFYTPIMRTEYSPSGLRVSSTSEQNYKNTSSTAMSMPAKPMIDGNRITSISADKIRTGKVESTSGDTYFDLDNGLIYTVSENDDGTQNVTQLIAGGLANAKMDGNEAVSSAVVTNSGVIVNASAEDDTEPDFPRREEGETALQYLVRIIVWAGQKLTTGISGAVTVLGADKNSNFSIASVRTSGAYIRNLSTGKKSEYRADGSIIDGNLVLNGSITGAYDTNWIYLDDSDLNNKFRFHPDGGFVRYRRIGKTVEIDGLLSPAVELGANDSSTMFTLPEGFRPSRYLRFICQGTGINKWLCSVGTNGGVALSRYGTTAYTAVPTSAWLVFNVTYLID